MGELIISLLVISFIGAGLALLLEIAHSYIANYGEVTININEKKDLTVTGGSPLMFSLMEQGIFIPSACGGRGTCSYCKVKVHDGGGPVLPTENLSKQELEQHVRLSCQVKVRNDIKIEIPEELFNVKEYKVKVAHVEELTPAIKGVTLDILSPEEGIDFKAGQYVQLQVPAYELAKEPDFRAFSLASSFREHQRIKLMITKAPEGLVSIYVHDYMKLGEELVMRGPFGDFYLRDSDREIILVATGSGLAPVRSILHQLETENIQRKSRLFFGARTKADLINHEELIALQDKLHGFTYMPILSGATEEDAWDGETGLITALIEKYIPDNPDVEVYICGSPIVVSVCEKAFMDKGLPADRIFYDKFA